MSAVFRAVLVSATRVRRPSGVAAFAIAAMLAGRGASAQEGGIAVGATAPGAAVETLDGKPTDLARYVTNGPVVLEFWATWCPLCKRLEPSMQAAREKYAGKVTFVSVGVPNNQTPDRQKAYAAEKKIGGEFVFDRESKAIGAYKVPHTSYVVVIDRGGKVVYTGVGGDQDIEAAVSKALPSGMGGGSH
jgi:thiol-disulfide isomerase/thioredoxin